MASELPTTDDVQNEMEQADWVTGIILNIFGSFSINFGTNLIQYSHFLTAKHKKSNIRSIKPSAIFCLAWLIFLSGNLLNFISFSFATQTVLSALGSVQFIANIIFGYLLFKLKPSKIQFLGTFLIIIGNICIVSVANKATFKFDSAQLIALFIRMQYVAYIITIVILSILFQLLHSYLIKHSKQGMSSLLSNDESSEEESLNPQNQAHIPTRTNRSRSPSLTNLVPDHPWHHKLRLTATANANILVPSCYALISAMIGSQSVVLAKSSSFLITESIGSDQQFTHPITYFFIVGWGVSTTFWLYRMNTALRKYEGVFIIPLLQVLWMLFCILSGGILFKEFDGYAWHNYIVFIIGTIIIFYGVYKLSPQDPDRNNAEHKSPKEVELLHSNNNSNEPLSSPSINNDEIQLTPSDFNLENVHQNIEEHIDPMKVKANLETLRANDDLITNESINLSSINSLRNSIGDPAIPQRENIRSPSIDLQSDSRSLRTIHNFFTTSQKILMKVTGADGRTHLSGPCLSSTLTSQDMGHLDEPSFSYNPYNAFATHDRLIPYRAQSRPEPPIITQSLPTVMPSDLKDAFEKIRSNNLKEEHNKKKDKDEIRIQLDH